MPKNNLVTGLDIGSSQVRVTVGKIEEDGSLTVLAACASPSGGIHKGSITSLEDSVTSISVALEQAERLSGYPIEHAVVCVSGHHVTTQVSRGVVAVGKADGEIQDSDVERVIQAAQTVSTPPNYEILHVVPRHYKVDDQEGIKDPLGMSGIRLEVETLLIEGLSNHIKNLTKAVYRAGVDIDDLVLGILATAEACLDKRQKELGVAIVNIGAATTSLAVFEEGELVHIAVIPVGSGHITSDIAIGLRIAIDVAEQIKLQEGTVLADNVSKREEINLNNYDQTEHDRVPRKQVAEIIQARVEEIFSLIRRELEKVNKAAMLPAGLILTGAGSQLPGMVEAAKSYFSLPVIVGSSLSVSTVVDSVRTPAYSTALGLLLWGYRHSNQVVAAPSQGVSQVMGFAGSVTKWLKNLLP